MRHNEVPHGRCECNSVRKKVLLFILLLSPMRIHCRSNTLSLISYIFSQHSGIASITY